MSAPRAQDGASVVAPSHVSLRLHFSNGARLGPGKVELLEQVGRHHSISGAARSMGMAYRRAWLLIDELNRTFAEPIIKTYPGRSNGAGAELTPFGERLVALYRAAERRAIRATAPQWAELEACLHPGGEGVTAPAAVETKQA